MWLPTPTGRTAAEYPLDIHGGGNISPYLLRSRNQWADLIKTMEPALKEYLAQKRADDVANQFLNMESPPRAEAVDQYGATYDPQLALRQGLNSTTEPRATPPNTGGERAYKADVLYRALLNDQQNKQQKVDSSYWQNKVRETQIKRNEAQARKFEADADAPDNRIPIQLPDGRTAMVTPNEAARYYDRRTTKQSGDSWTKLDRDVFATSGRHLSDWNAATNKRIEDGQFKADLPDGSTITMGTEMYQGALNRYHALEGKSPANVLPSPDLPPEAQSSSVPDTTPRPSSKADYDALPPGVLYYAPDGKLRRKP